MQTENATYQVPDAIAKPVSVLLSFERVYGIPSQRLVIEHCIALVEDGRLKDAQDMAFGAIRTLNPTVAYLLEVKAGELLANTRMSVDERDALQERIGDGRLLRCNERYPEAIKAYRAAIHACYAMRDQQRENYTQMLTDRQQRKAAKVKRNQANRAARAAENRSRKGGK